MARGDADAFADHVVDLLEAGAVGDTLKWPTKLLPLSESVIERIRSLVSITDELPIARGALRLLRGVPDVAASIFADESCEDLTLEDWSSLRIPPRSWPSDLRNVVGKRRVSDDIGRVSQVAFWFAAELEPGGMERATLLRKSLDQLSDLTWGMTGLSRVEQPSMSGYVREGVADGLWCLRNRLLLLTDALGQDARVGQREAEVTLLGLLNGPLAADAAWALGAGHPVVETLLREWLRSDDAELVRAAAILLANDERAIGKQDELLSDHWVATAVAFGRDPDRARVAQRVLIKSIGRISDERGRALHDHALDVLPLMGLDPELRLDFAIAVVRALGEGRLQGQFVGEHLDGPSMIHALEAICPADVAYPAGVLTGLGDALVAMCDTARSDLEVLNYWHEHLAHALSIPVSPRC